jgi:hypothetical protein
MRPARDSAFHRAFSGSPDLPRRGCSPCAAALRRRHSGSPPLSPQGARRRPGGVSAANEAPQPPNAIAPPLAVDAPPCPRRRRPRPAAATPAQDQDRWISFQRPRSCQRPGQSSPIPVNMKPAPALDPIRPIVILWLRSTPSA